MTMPMCEDGGVLREWSPLTTLLQQVPAKVQNGIFTYDISFTCIDAVPEFIAVGTNYGLIYWYDREKQDLQRLRCENTNAKITCVRVISTVDYMVAAGNEHGVVTVFQIPKNPPDSLPDSLKPKQKQQVERYTISGLHKGTVTAIEWSKNGMKLFSGDQDGLVVLTEIDFYMHLSKSSELLNEKYSVVQLSYRRGLLLVSTILRTILVNRNENNKVTQVGQKERKVLGKLGATFADRQGLNPQDAIIYASRPGLRLWQADKAGTVSKTLIFKDAIRPGQMKVELLNPAPEATRKSRTEPTFGVILPFCEELLVTYGDDVVYVVDPRSIAITAVITDIRRVCDVACTKDEIFILEGERNIIRVAYCPEICTVQFPSEYFPDPSSMSFVDPIASIAEIGKPVATGILELTSKLKESSIIPAIPFPKIDPSSIIRSTVTSGTTTVTNAEEAVEVPMIIKSKNVDSPLIKEIDNILEFNDTFDPKNNGCNSNKENDRRLIFQKISQQEFEDVVFTPERKTKKSHKKSWHENGNEPALDFSDESVINNSKKIESDNNIARTMTTHSSLLTLSVYDTTDDFILKSERNLETIRQDVENKEKLLADVLDFDLSKYTTSSKICTEEPSCTSDANDAINYNVDNRLPNFIIETRTEDNNDDNEQIERSSETESEDEEEISYRLELKKLEELGECRKQLLREKLIESVPSTTMHNDIKVNIRKSLSTTKLNQSFSAESPPIMLEEEGWVIVKDDTLL